jgi:hypothetical protein
LLLRRQPLPLGSLPSLLIRRGHEEGVIATLTNNLSACTIDLEAHRLAWLTETTEDKAAFEECDGDATTTAPDSTDPTADSGATSSDTGISGGGAAAGIVVTVLVLAAAIGGYIWYQSRTKQQQQRARDAVDKEVGGGGEVVEMMENPLRTWINQEYAPPAVLPPAMIYYSEPKDPSTTTTAAAEYATGEEGGAVYASAEAAPSGSASRVALDADMYVAGGAPPVVQADAGTYVNTAAYHDNGGGGSSATTDAALYTTDPYATVPGSSTATNA